MKETVIEYVAEGINYLDVAGNCNIRQHNLVLLVEGKKIELAAKSINHVHFRKLGSS